MARPRYGYRRLHILLRREGWKVNAKRVWRLYCEEQLTVRVKRRKKRTAESRLPAREAERPNEQWSLDFMHDRLEDGRSFRILNVIDAMTREWEKGDLLVGTDEPAENEAAVDGAQQVGAEDFDEQGQHGSILAAGLRR